jgi:hypothetical protein
MVDAMYDNMTGDGAHESEPHGSIEGTEPPGQVELHDMKWKDIEHWFFP